MFPTVSRVMRTDLYTLPVTGLTIRELGWYQHSEQKKQTSIAYSFIEEILHSTAVQGYPVVSVDGQNSLLGYVGRAELRYVLGEL